jgi:hypothetical protein
MRRHTVRGAGQVTSSPVSRSGSVDRQAPLYHAGPRESIADSAARGLSQASDVLRPVAQPSKPLAQSLGIVWRNEESGHGVFDNLRQAGDPGRDTGCATGHAFEKGLAEQFRHGGFASVRRTVHAGKNHAAGPSIRLDEVGVGAVVAKRDGLAKSKLSKSREVLRVIRTTDDLQGCVGGKTLYQIIDALVRDQAPDVNRWAVPWLVWAGSELLDVNAPEDDVRGGMTVMSADATAVFADVEVTVVPPIRGHVR